MATYQEWLSKRGTELEPTLTEISSKFSEVWKCWLLLVAPPTGFLTPSPQKSTVKWAVGLGLEHCAATALSSPESAVALSQQGAHPTEQSPVSREFLYQIRPVAVKLGLPRGEELRVGLWGLFLTDLCLVLFDLFFQISL